MGCLGTCLDCRFLSGGLHGYFFHRAFGSNRSAKCTSYPRRVTNSSKRRDIKPETGFAQLLYSGVRTGLGEVSHKAAVKLLATSATPQLKSARGRGGGGIHCQVHSAGCLRASGLHWQWAGDMDSLARGTRASSVGLIIMWLASLS